MSIVFKDNKLVIDISNVARTQAQRLKLKELLNKSSLADALEYIETFQGKRHRSIHVDRFQVSGNDVLGNKGKNSILHRINLMRRTDANHTPINSLTDWVGVEIECLVPRIELPHVECPRCEGSGVVSCVREDDEGVEYDDEETCDDCDGSGVRDGSIVSAMQELLKQKDVRLCSAKHDGSIETDDCDFAGVEITVLTRLSNMENLKRVCKVLSDIGAKVNKSCGMHIHLDSRHRNEEQVKAVGSKFSKVLPALLKLVPQSRRSNTYCKASVSKLSGCRYHAINLTAYRKYRTIEVRLHSSTTDFDKISRWLELCNAIAESETIKSCDNINDLEQYVNIKADTLEYFTQREELFSARPQNVSRIAVDQDDEQPQQIGA